MAIDIRIPSVGESVREAVLAQWTKREGDRVQKGEVILIIETDKVTLEISAEADGILHILVQEGQTVAIGTVVGSIAEESAASAGSAPVAADSASGSASNVVISVPEPTPENAPPPPLAAFASAQPAPALAPANSSNEPQASASATETASAAIMLPAARRLIQQHGIDPARIIPSGLAGRMTKGDVLLYLERKPPETPVGLAPQTAPMSDGLSGPAAEPDTVRKPMSPIRKRIAERLLDARRNTAMLTTFNEIDMSQVMALRAQYKDVFQKRHGIGLGMMSFFVKACVTALHEIPELNAFIEDDTILYHKHCNIGVAVGGERGLVVPVIRNAETLSFAGIESAIVDFVRMIQENRLALSALEGGTFTITNGGVFGSLMSTPILNPPQSGILGMHKVEKRPVVIGDAIVIRPMMYVALSYDHRIVDGKGAVTFLKRVKECVEAPERIFLEV
jgi:2-oxoglutarate dehydrogenase E2 component (dihydrolipoamide succinyltransferase)